MHNLENEDKILKIFSRVRCFNRDQLPRYVDGRLTHIEKHLLEQHLVNCELCSDAVQILQKPKFKTQYQSMGLKVQEYIRRSTYQLPQVHEAERYQRKVQNKESVLIYFWGAVGVALLIGCIYLAQQQVKKESRQQFHAKTEKVATPATGSKPGHDVSIAAPALAAPVTAATSTAVTPSIKKDGEATQALVKEPGKVETASSTITDETAGTDKFLFKTAMAFYRQGNLEEAMPRFTQLIADSTSSYRELARYQLAICFKFKGQKAKARQQFRELVNMNGKMKRRAQLALMKL
jgi:TolA-binding protein